MTLIKPDGNDGATNEVLRVAAEHLERAIRILERSTNRIESGEDNPSPEYEKIVRHFGGATQVLLKEKQKIDDSIKKDAGIIYDYAIDFEKAREEIRCRMASLRAVADPTDISE